MGLLVCPVCGKPLVKNDKSYICEGNHSFDISSEGYIHLLMSNKMNSKLPGDNKQMINARFAFLQKGYYKPLADKLAEILFNDFTESGNSHPVVVDAGCGEGYYTEKIFDTLTENGLSPAFVGLDISKIGVRLAAKRKKRITFAVSSVFDMPILSGSADCILSLFAPICAEQFVRVLKNKGSVYIVAPAKNHLFELKSQLYEKPYSNDEQPPELEGFTLESANELKYNIELNSSEDIAALFAMTPYYYKTPKEAAERLAQLSQLTTEVGFIIYRYKKSTI